MSRKLDHTFLNSFTASVQPSTCTCTRTHRRLPDLRDADGDLVQVTAWSVQIDPACPVHSHKARMLRSWANFLVALLITTRMSRWRRLRLWLPW